VGHHKTVGKPGNKGRHAACGIAALLATAAFTILPVSAKADSTHSAMDATRAKADSLTAAEAQAFIERYVAAWASDDPATSLGALWDAEGKLYDPLLDHVLSGAQIPALTRAQLNAAPDLVWTLLDWTMRGDTIIMEWRNEWTLAGKRFEWQGVDKMTLKNGKIVEERVYMDTAPLRAAKEGKPLRPITSIESSQ
jgi:hypothetical protein